MGLLDVKITDGERNVRVTPSGELVVSNVSYDEVVFNELDLVNTAYNFYLPKAHKQFIITSMLTYGDKQVSTSTNATVIIYEASSPTSIVVDKVLLQFEIGQNQSVPFTPLRVKVTGGKWVNAKTDDDDIHMSIMGYYIDAVD